VNSIVLMDIERHRACDLQLTFVKTGERIDWMPSSAFKFIMFNTGELVIGPISAHSSVYTAYNLQTAPVDGELKKKSAAFQEDAWKLQPGRVIGAGEAAPDGHVKGWKSTCFRVETPAHLKAEIQAELTRLFQEGKLTPP
jgi:hypothetical protein